MRLQSEEQHPHGMNQQEYDALFTRDKPILFQYIAEYGVDLPEVVDWKWSE